MCSLLILYGAVLAADGPSPGGGADCSDLREDVCLRARGLAVCEILVPGPHIIHPRLES